MLGSLISLAVNLCVVLPLKLFVVLPLKTFGVLASGLGPMIRLGVWCLLLPVRLVLLPLRLL